MLYINTGEKRLLVAVRRIKKWIYPGASVDLNSIDIRMLGANGQYMRPATEAQAKVAAEKKATAPAEEKKAPAKKKAAAKSPEKSDKQLRKELSDALNEMTKDELTDFGEDQLGYDVKSRDKKADIIKKLLGAAKKIGYAKVLKKVG